MESMSCAFGLGVKRILIVVFPALLLVLCLLYAGDSVLARRRPLASVSVQRYYAVLEKDRKTEFMFAEPENQPCVHSLFPHFGYAPCWYLRRHAVQRITM